MNLSQRYNFLNEMIQLEWKYNSEDVQLMHAIRNNSIILNNELKGVITLQSKMNNTKQMGFNRAYERLCYDLGFDPKILRSVRKELGLKVQSVSKSSSVRINEAIIRRIERGEYIRYQAILRLIAYYRDVRLKKLRRKPNKEKL